MLCAMRENIFSHTALTLVIIGGSYMATSILPALLMSAIAFLIPLAQIVLFKALLRSGIKN